MAGNFQPCAMFIGTPLPVTVRKETATLDLAHSSLEVWKRLWNDVLAALPERHVQA